MTDEKLEYINSLRDALRNAKNQLSSWAGEGRGYEHSPYTGVASFLCDDKEMFAKVDKLQTQYEAL